jgi:hypothetical protein
MAVEDVDGEGAGDKGGNGGDVCVRRLFAHHLDRVGGRMAKRCDDQGVRRAGIKRLFFC